MTSVSTQNDPPMRMPKALCQTESVATKDRGRVLGRCWCSLEPGGLKYKSLGVLASVHKRVDTVLFDEYSGYRARSQRRLRGNSQLKGRDRVSTRALVVNE